MAAAASSGVPLVSQGQRLAILPEVYGIDDLREAITNYDTIVLMEINPNLMRALANLESWGWPDTPSTSAGQHRQRAGDSRHQQAHSGGL